ncbi:MAG: PQQ-binding-like beta-propeller repeat protein, partial [Planctomycetota bacterium]
AVGKARKVVGVGCKNGGFFVLDASSGKLVAQTPVYAGPPKYPLQPARDPRTIALPGLIGGIQTGCATNGEDVFTNGTDWISLASKKRGLPEAGRVVSLSMDLSTERWRHERPKVSLSGDPVASGVALGGGVVCFTTTVSKKLVVVDAESGKTVRDFDVGTVWSGPSISRGRIYVGTGSILFLGTKSTGTLFSFGIEGRDEVERMGVGSESAIGPGR